MMEIRNFKKYCGLDGAGCEKAICHDETWYYGKLTDEQFGIPNGLGAYYSPQGAYLVGGIWSYGVLIKNMSYDEYNKQMNELQKAK